MKGARDFSGKVLEPDGESRHLPAVEQVITVMRGREDGALCLHVMAEIANLSPYHFARTFRKVTGSPPGEFLTAWRLQRAKQLLLDTDLGVAEICHEVGYESVGTFTTNFKRLVGISPGKLRRLPEELYEVLGHAESVAGSVSAAHTEAGVAFRVRDSEPADGMVFVGLFPTAIPQGRPAAGTILEAPGAYRLHPVPDGNYHLMAAALPPTEDPIELLQPGDALRVGRAESPLAVRGGKVGEHAEVALRPVRAIDPPVLLALPALLLERLAVTTDPLKEA